MPDHSQPTEGWRPPLIASLALTAILLVFFHRVVFFGEVFSPADLLFEQPPWMHHYGHTPASNRTRGDEVFLIHPTMSSHWERLTSGELPHLDPSHLSGTPAFLQGMYAGLPFNPLAVFYYLLPAERADGLFAFTRLLLAGLFMWAYCRRIGLQPSARLFAAIAFMLNGHFIVWLSAPIPTVGLWLPLGLWAAEGLLARPGLRSALVLALVLAPMFLGGYLPTLIISLLIVGTYVLAGSRSSPRPMASLSYAALGAGVSAAIGAVGLAPPVVNLQASDLAIRISGLAVYHPRNLATFIFPDFWGSPLDDTWWNPATNYCEAITYVGLAPLVLTPIGVVRGHGWRPWFFAAWGIFALGYVYGVPGFQHLGEAPVLKSVNGYRWVLGLVLAVSVLSGMGLDAVLRAGDGRGSVGRLAAGVSILLIGGYAAICLAAWPRLPEWYRDDIVWGGARGAAILLATAGLVVASRRSSERGPIVAAGLIALLAVDLVSAQIDFNPTIPAERNYPTTPGIEWLQRHSEGARVAFAGELPVGIVPGVLPARYGLRAVGGYDFLRLERYQRFLAAANMFHPAPDARSGFVFFERSLDPTSPILDLLSVRFIATPLGIDVYRRRQVASVTRSDSPVGEIVDGRTVGQSFGSPLPGLAQIDIYPATYGRTNRGTLVFHLREEGAATDAVTREIPLREVPDNLEMAISFEPIADSAGKRYRFWLESPGAAPGNAITLWTQASDGYAGGARLEGGRPIDGDLRFRAYVQPLADDPALREAFRGDLNIVENLNARPAAWVVRETEVASGEAAVTRLRSEVDITRRAIVERPLMLVRSSAPYTGETTTVRRPAPERLIADVSLAAEGLLVVSEIFDRRWSAALDGEPVELLRVNEVLCGVIVPAGRHQIVLTYFDPVVVWSAAASALALVLVLAVLATVRPAHP